MKTILCICLLLPLSTATARELKLLDQTSRVEFTAVGRPSFLKIRGTTNTLQAHLELDQEQQISGHLIVPLESLTTGIELRDQHMKENYLQTATFPNAEIHLKALPYEGNGTFPAILKLHGQEKNLEIELETNGNKRTATFQVNIQDFAIPVPVYQGITVAKEVTVTTSLEFLPQ